jgi:L-fuconate dehydratase
LHAAEPGRAERTGHLLEHGYPAYTTSPGWLGYSDDKLRSFALTAVADGFTQIKLKVGADLADDVRRLRVARDTVGPDIRIAIDANQRWDLADAITWIAELAPFDPY